MLFLYFVPIENIDLKMNTGTNLLNCTMIYYDNVLVVDYDNVMIV